MDRTHVFTERPKIVCLCGSTRFGDAFHEANLRETLAGNIVLSIGCDFKSDKDLELAGTLTADDKKRLDELHLENHKHIRFLEKYEPVYPKPVTRQWVEYEL